MANNRMYLVHKLSGTKILLAKYYPSTNWYRFHEIEKLDSWMEALPHAKDMTFGNTGFVLEFEVDNDESMTTA